MDICQSDVYRLVGKTKWAIECSQFSIETIAHKSKFAMPTSADIEFRVAAFAAAAIDVCESMVSKIGKAHLQDQLFRAATSVAANYAEACVPESRKDFAHKTNIALKELIETRMWLRIIAMRNYADQSLVSPLLQETEELIKIFYASVTTARRNLNEQNGR